MGYTPKRLHIDAMIGLVTSKVLIKTHLNTFPSTTSQEEIMVDTLSQRVMEYIPPYKYYFILQKKAMIKKDNKRKIESIELVGTPPKIIWDGSQLNEEQLEKELAHSMRAFSNANVWLVNNLLKILKQKNDNITKLGQQCGKKILWDSKTQQRHTEKNSELQQEVKIQIDRLQHEFNASNKMKGTQLSKL